MEDILNLDIGNIEFQEKPPMENGKIVKLDVVESQYGNGNVLRIYIIDKDTDFVRVVSLRVTNRSPSKFSMFVERLKEAGFKGRIKDLEGKIFRWEFRKVKIGSFDTSLWLPVELVGEEPVDALELASVEEYMAGLSK